MKKVVVHRFQEHFKKQRKIVAVINNFDNNPELVQIKFEGGVSLLMGTAEFNKVKKQIPEDLWKKNSVTDTSAPQATSTTQQEESRSASQPTKKGVAAARVSVKIRNTSKNTSTEKNPSEPKGE